MRTFTMLFLPCLAAAAGTQVTSPKGYENTEGNQVIPHFGGSRRFQQIDFTHAGAPMLIRSIAWRRDANASQGTGARRFDFRVDLGHANFGAISQLFDANFLSGSRTTVFNQTAVNFPDWRMALPGPTPFDFRVALAMPYVYLGVDALVIDSVHVNNSLPNLLATDRAIYGLPTPAAGVLHGRGCTATGRNAEFTHVAYMSNHDPVVTSAYGMRLRLGGDNAPNVAPIVLALIDVTNPSLTGPLCTTLYARPLVTLTLTALATGLVPDVSFGFTHDPALVGATLYTQLAGPDPGQSPIGVALSNGRQTIMTGTVETGSLRCSYGFYTLPSATGTGNHYIGGGMVHQLQ